LRRWASSEVRSIESIESESAIASARRITPGRALTERIQAPTLSESSRAASGMAPGVVGIHPAREHGQLGVQAREVLQVGPVHPGREVADTYAFARAPGVGQVQRGVAGLERQAQLGRQLGVGELPFGGQLTAELHGAPVRQPFLLQAATRALARFQYDHVHAGAGQIARRRQTGQPGPRHHDVVS
jgi:hypothetical protein